jgi:endonuclease/exonuclease/phosphatase (EEP) superfamily protein YafD
MSRFVALVNGVLTVLVLAAAVGAVLALGGSRDPRLDVFAHFAPVYGAVGLAGAVWALVAGRGPVIAAAVLAVLASGLLVLPEMNRDAGPVAAAEAPGQLKVIQINALYDNPDIGRVADWLVAQKPDVITVTEARHDLRDLLVRRGWKTAGSGGDLMIFTRQRYARMNRPRVPPSSLLNFVNASYALPGGAVEVVTTHLGWPTTPFVREQTRGLASVIARLPRDRMILTGDFNATPWSQELQGLDAGLRLTRRDRGVPTWPAQVLGRPWPLPFLPIDHVYAGPGWATVKVERGPWVGSDHYPLIVTLAPVAQR